MCLFMNARDTMFAFVVLVWTVSFCSSTIQQTKVNTRTLRQAPAETSEPCICVPYYYCNSDNVIITNGVGVIDIRNARAPTRMNSDMEPLCEDYLELCCRLPASANDSPKCGIRRGSRRQQFIQRLDKEEADSGEFPWMVTIFSEKTVQRNNETEKIKVYECQGSLISDKVVLTAAQCVVQHVKSRNSLSIQAGQFDTMLTNEESSYQEIGVQRVIPHGKYNAMKLTNNIALLLLKTPVIINKYVDITCLAHRTDVIDEDKCLFIGWDKYLAPEDAKTQRSQNNNLKRRTLAHVKSPECGRQLQNTPLGKRFKLDNCSMCAGGSTDQNFCSNEVGGPLACPLKSEPSRYVQVGVASWCIKSGKLQTPSVFASIVNLLGWIDNKMNKLRLDASVYRATKP